VESQESVLGTLREQLQGLARDEGLTAAKLEGSSILLMSSPSHVSPPEAARALVNVIIDSIAGLRDEKERSAARAMLNVDGPRTTEHTATARQVALARQRHTHQDTVRRWWRHALDDLAPLVLARIDELNSDPSAWLRYMSDEQSLSAGGKSDLSGYHFEQVDLMWRLRGRTATEMLTFRRLVAREDGLDRVKARGWYFSDPSPDACRIEPLFNCAMVDFGHVGRGIQLAELVFAEPLRRGQEVFYGYRVVVHSDKELDTLFYHHVTSAGVRRLNFHVQFDPSMPPAVAWRFATNDDAEPMIPPVSGSDSYLEPPNNLGYLGHHFRDARHGLKCGIAWRWSMRNHSPES